MSLSMQLAQIRVKVKAVVAAGNQHRKILDRTDDLAGELADICALNNFLVEELGGCHLVILVVLAFVFCSLGLFILFLGFSFFFAFFLSLLFPSL